MPTTNTTFTIQRCEQIFQFERTNIDQVMKIVKHLTKKVNKSDKCNSLVLFDAMDYIGYFLTNIINESLVEGQVPNAWKTLIVVPIPEKTNTKNAAEHRGINMFPIEEKICEIIVKEQIIHYIESNELLSPYQSAYRATHSCESAINFVINDWKLAMDDGQYVVVVFLDLKRAFEIVDRDIMIEKLQSIGIHDTEMR